MATYNFDAKATLPDGGIVVLPGPITEKGKQPEAEVASIGRLIYTALNAHDDDKSVTPVDRYNRAKLAVRIHGGGDVELSIDEAKLIKDVCGKFPWANNQVLLLIWDALEQPKV